MDGPVVKRQKLESSQSQPPRPKRSSVFAPFRTLGLISTTEVPFTYNPLTFQITTSVGRSLITYSLVRGLNRIWITRPETPSQITATTSWKKIDMAAFGDPRKGEPQGLWCFQRGDRVTEVELPRDMDEPISQIHVLGSWTVACGLTRIDVFKSLTLEHYTTIRCVGPKSENEITGGICSMPTYLNKIWVGRKNGWVELWNIRTGKLLHTYTPPSSDCGAVTCLEPTPALGLVAIAYASGRLVIQDVLRDVTAVDLQAGTEDAPVTSIAFRTDKLGAGEDGQEDGVIATSTRASGDITFWDLNDGGRITGVHRSAHNPPSVRGGAVRGGINKIEFLPEDKVIISSGLDNSIKTWIFDQNPFSSTPRVLHSRSGHAAQVNCLQWLQSDFDGHEAGKKWLLTGSEDRSVWGWSLRKDGQTSELSQGHLKKIAKKRGLLTTDFSGRAPTSTIEDLKAPEVTCIASSLNRDGGIGAIPGKLPIWQREQNKARPADTEISLNTGWESVITGHKGDPYARTWFWGRRRAGRWAFMTKDKSNVSTVALSSCGTFAFVGSVAGGIDMFNLQSGMHRQRFPSALTPAQARQVKMQQLKQADDVSKLKAGAAKTYPPGVGKHTGSVTGIVASPAHSWLVSCSLDGKVKFWDFQTGNLLDELWWGTGITSCKFHAGTELVAFACEDQVIRLVDVGTRKVVRQFRGCQGKINDLCWSQDARWIIAASQDSTIRVWDLPTGNMVDGIRLEKPCIALAMAESNEYLATAIEGEIGIRLWINLSFFRRTAPTRLITEADIAIVGAPKAVASAVQHLSVADIEDAIGEVEPEGEDSSLLPTDIEQMNSGLMTLSLVPKSKWQTLLHLDEIKKRNKPTEAPKQPEKAPFFLPSKGEKAALAEEDEKATDGGSRISRLEKYRSTKSLTMMLRRGATAGDYVPYIEVLKSLAPSDADLEISSLSIGDGAPGENDLVNFLDAVTARRRQKRDFEIIEVWMKVFMKAHDDEISGNEEVGAAFKVWHGVSKESWKELDQMVSYCTASFNYFMNPEA